MSDIRASGKINTITINSVVKSDRNREPLYKEEKEHKNMNKSNQEVNQSCLNCMYEYVCDWKYTSEELSCDRWQSDKEGDLSNKRIWIS